MKTSSVICAVAGSRGLAAAACVAAMFFLLVSTSPSQAQQRPVLTRHVREAVVNGQARLVGRLSPTQRLQLAITLPWRNQAQLDNLLQELYNPESPLYRHYLTVQEFTARFGPTPEDYATVVHFAEANGMTVTETSPNRFLVDVEGSVGDIESAFHVTMHVYQHPTEARTFYGPDREPTADLDVPLWHITGLDNFSPPKPRLRFAPEGDVDTFQTGSGSGGQFLGSDMRAAYYGGTALTGAGQSIGLYGSNFNISDVDAYFNAVGQSFNPTVVQTISINGYGTSCGRRCDDTEPVLDIVESLSMAPGVNAVIAYEASTDVDTFNRMATDNIAKQLSTSFGWEPADPSSDEPIFQEFAAQGQTLFAASDDSGAYSSANPVFYPADDPLITAVGGTDLTTNGAGGSWQSESAWIDSGGGVSTNGFSIPSYQQLPGVITASNHGSTTLRNGPDVAAEANTDNYICYDGTCAGGWGGTSFAAPRWAGFLALVNEQAANTGQPSVGFLNPTIYAIGTGANYNNDFHDITSGNNANRSASFNAVVGYDLVTGWGSPNGQNLINALAGSGFTLSDSPSSLTITQGGAGGTSTITVNDQNGFSGSVSLTASGLPSGVTVAFNPSSTSGTSTLTLTASSSATTGKATVTITGTSGSLLTTTTLALVVVVNTPPSGSLTINSGASYTPWTAVTLALTATDTVGVTGYYVSSSATPPAATAAGWVAVTSTTSFTSNVAYTLPSGDGTKTVYAWYKDAAGNVSTTASASILLDQTPPTNGTLTANAGSGQVALSWSGFSDGGSGLASTNTYKLMFSTGGFPAASCTSGTQLLLGTATSFTHTGLTNGTTYSYRVCAFDAAGNVSTGATASDTPEGSGGLSFTFTDDPLVPDTTVIKAVHVTELRAAVNTQRSRVGLGPFSYTDPTLVQGSTPVKAVHLTDLRTALTQAYQAAGQTPPTYTDATLVAGQTVIKASHWNELRAAVRALQ